MQPEAPQAFGVQVLCALCGLWSNHRSNAFLKEG